MFLKIITLLGAAGLFLYGLNLLSAGMLKLTGDRLRGILPWMQRNPLNGILSGFGITAVVESSSAATVMVVGFVNAGVLALSQAILVIMGANIGASFTTWVIAVFGFGLGVQYFTYPLIAAGFILMMLKGQKKKTAGEVMLGFGLLFLGLSYMIGNFPSVEDFPGINPSSGILSGNGFVPILMFMAIGCVLAFAMQSTGAVTLTMVMMSAGWIGFDMAAAMVMGENIGTTISANIAASEANIPARGAALVHTLFNVIGAVLALIFFHPFIRLTGLAVSAFGLPDPARATAVEAGGAAIWAGVAGIATFHTLFNLLNTCILAWFTRPLEKLVAILVKAPEGFNEAGTRLKYISSRNFGTPAISISMAFKEVAHFGEMMHEGFAYAGKALNEQNPDKFEEYRTKLVHFEELSDRLEYQIAEFLNKVSAQSISEEEAEDIKVLYRVIGELESLGDSGENISRILDRERIHNRKFDEEAIRKMNEMLGKVDVAYSVMVENLKVAASGTLTDISNAYHAEDEINDTRNTMREESISRIENHVGNYQSLNYFLDIIAELEAMGDFMINISQAVAKN